MLWKNELTPDFFGSLLHTYIESCLEFEVGIERERERSRGVCVTSSSSSSSAAAQEGIWIAPFCSFVYLSRSKLCLRKSLWCWVQCRQIKKKIQINSNQIKWRKGICQTAAHHHHALSEVAFFNPFGGVPIPEKMGDPLLGLNCMHTHP